MRRLGAQLAAETIFLAHCAQILVALFGWLFPSPWYYVYLADISIALVSQFIFHDCFLTNWEFYFRRKLDPSILGAPYYLTYYSHKYFTDWVTNDFVDRISLIFLSVSILAAALRISGSL